MKPTLFICIGGSGMKIGHALKYNFATYKPDLLLSPDGSSGKVKFLFIENDVNEAGDRLKPYYRFKKGIFNIDEFLQVGNVNTKRIVERIKKSINENRNLTDIDEDINQWVDKKIDFPDAITENGLAACRQIGRIAFATGFDHIYSKITTATTKLANIASKNKDGNLEANSIEIFIVSGICGGTGSSMFLDISALLDGALGIHQSPLKKAVLINTNYFLEQKLSDNNISKTHEQYLNLQMNSVALINECEYFINNKDKEPTLLGKYTARNSKQENRVRIGYEYSPFSSAFIFDIHAHNQRKIPLSKFYYVVADMLFYTCISQTSVKFASDIEANATVKGKDAEDNNHIQYSTLALKVVQYPHEEFLDYFKTRYLYEVFTNVLLNKSLKSDVIAKKADEFVRNVFDDSENSIFASIGSDFKNRLIEFQSKDDLFDEARYQNDNGKLIKKDEIIDLLNNIDSRKIAEIKDELEQKKRTMPDLGFKTKYKGNPTVADQLRGFLLKYVREVIYSHGYYGVLGISEGSNFEPGFIGEIDRILRAKYKELTRFKALFNEIELLNTITTSKNSLIESLNKFRLRLGFKDIKAEIDAYHNAVGNYLDNLFAYTLCQLQQEILYYFVVGDRKSDINDSFYSAELEQNSTELNKYRDGLAIAVGSASNKIISTQSLISVYDKGANDDSDTIRNSFVKFLPNRWNSTQKDIFTVYVPANLYDYTDSESSDNWKANTDLDSKFKENIIIDNEELSSIFDDDPENINLLSAIGMDSDKINRNINLILDKINAQFLVKYYENSTHPISQYLNKTIQDVYNDGDDITKKKIKDQKSALAYPVCDSTTSRIPVPYLNIHPDNIEFVQNQLEFDIEKTIEQDSMPKHQMAFVGIVQGIDFHSISGNAENMQVYKDRNLKVFRPHLHFDWNDYVMGPIEAMKESIIESGNSSYQITDAILISYFFEKLIEVKPELNNIIFVEKDIKLSNNNGRRSTPITFNPKTKMFSYYRDGFIMEENEREKFYVKRNHNADGENLGKLFENLEIDNAVKTINKDSNFAECFDNFISVIKEHKAGITSLINTEVNAQVSKEISDIKVKLDKVLGKMINKKVNVSQTNQEFVGQFSIRTKELIDELLEINLEM